MKLSCVEHLVPGRTMEEKLDNLERAGYEGIELVADGGLRARVKEIKEALSVRKVKVSGIMAGNPSTGFFDTNREIREKSISDIREDLEIVVELAATAVTILPGMGLKRLPDLSPYATTYKLEHELLVSLLRELSTHAEKMGSTICIEPANRYETQFVNRLEQGVRICQQVRSDKVKLTADFYHMNIEEIDIPRALKEAGEYIHHIHLGDNSRLLPGNGHIDFVSGFSVLKKIGYEDYMAIEAAIVGEDRLEQLKRSADFLQKCIKDA